MVSGPANPVILEWVTNMAIGTEPDITEFEELALPRRGRPHRHLPAD
jgi:glyoxylate carboligase